jgi:hypothetical protein
VAEFPAPVPDHRYRPYDEWYLPNAAGHYVKSLAAARCGSETLLAAGTDGGDLAVWDFMTGAMKGSRMSVNVGAIDEICFGSINGEPVLIAGATDGMRPSGRRTSQSSYVASKSVTPSRP